MPNSPLMESNIIPEYDSSDLYELSNTQISITKKLEQVRYITIGTIVTSFIIFFMIIAVISYVSPLINDANKLLSDGSKIINDLNIIIPDVKKSLQILDNLCRKYPDYCNDSTVN